MKKVILPFLLLTHFISAQFSRPLDSCNFESSCSIVTLNNSAGNIWQIGEPSKTIFDSAHSVPNALITDSLNVYPTLNHSSFVLEVATKPVSFLGDMSKDNVAVSFWYKLDSDSLLDGGFIEVSYDRGQSWYNVVEEYDTIPYCSSCIGGFFHMDNLYYSDTLYDGTKGLSGAVTEWKQASLTWVWSAPLKAAQTRDTIFLRFNFISDNIQTNKEGWMIDDIKITYDDLSSVKENKMANLKIYPNPIQDNLTIEIVEEIDFKNPVNFRLVDLAGRIVLDKQILYNRESLSTQQLADGVYTAIIFQNETSIYTQKIIKL